MGILSKNKRFYANYRQEYSYIILAISSDIKVLVTLIELYEKKNFPIENPSPLKAIKFRMEQLYLSQTDLIPIIGSKSKVSEVL
nr:hypothetical protein [uncultured Treponema sp.]